MANAQHSEAVVQGIGSIEPAEGMRALDRLLRSPMPQLGFLKATREDVRGGVFDLVGDARVRLHPARFDSLAQTLAHGAAPVFPGDAAQLAAEGREIDRLALAILRGELQALGLTDSALVTSRLGTMPRCAAKSCATRKNDLKRQLHKPSNRYCEPCLATLGGRQSDNHICSGHHLCLRLQRRLFERLLSSLRSSSAEPTHLPSRLSRTRLLSRQ